MVIKKKDGSVYRLSGPNPIMKNQSFWEADKSIVHNFNPVEIITKIEQNEELQNIEPEEIHVSIKEVEPSQLPSNIKKRIVPTEVVKKMVHCLPAFIKEFHDPLYGESRSTLSYGNKFTMEVVVASQSDLNIVLWTNSIEVGKGSIIYIPENKRWWKVTDETKRNEGVMISCLPSDIQPSFE